MKIIRYADAAGEIALAWLDAEGNAHALEADLFENPRPLDALVNPVRLLTPLDPPAIIGTAQNYRAHAAEMGKPPPERPVFFYKLPWSATPTGDPIVLPRGTAHSDQVDYEGELAVIIGKHCKDVNETQALDYVLGYTCANDVSARDWQYKWSGGQYNRAKSFDSFCPLGPCILTADEVPDPSQLHLRSALNGETVQESPLSDLIFTVPRLIAELSAGTTLLAGTVILTGTPSGVGHGRKPARYLSPGDTFSVEIERIGTLINPVVEAQPQLH